MEEVKRVRDGERRVGFREAAERPGEVGVIAERLGDGRGGGRFRGELEERVEQESELV